MSAAVPKITCGACGRSFAWRPEYAGKTLKCKCGEAIKAPAIAPVATPAAPPRAAQGTPASAPRMAPAVAKPAEPEDEFAKLQGQAEEEYGLADAPPPPQPLKRVTVAPPAVTPAVTSPVLPYGGGVRKRPADEGGGKGLAIASLVLGIVSCAMFWFCIPWLPRFLGILALLLGIRAISQGAGGMAKAGMILGIVGVVTTFLFWMVISKATERLGNTLQQNAQQWQKQMEQMQKQAEEAQRKAEQEKQTQRQNLTTQPGGVIIVHPPGLPGIR